MEVCYEYKTVCDNTAITRKRNRCILAPPGKYSANEKIFVNRATSQHMIVARVTSVTVMIAEANSSLIAENKNPRPVLPGVAPFVECRFRSIF